MDLKSFRTLGRSGLIVSPLALGTMTFGNAKWGSPDDVSEAVFNAYVDAGGNFIDTAEAYGKGHSEELVGQFTAKRGLRDRLVLATKCAYSAEPGNPNAAGNGRKNMLRALDGSLKRLGTDYIDLYWVHAGDQVTPVEEVLQTLGDLQRSGKIRYFAFSGVPAWYVARAVTYAQAHAMPGPIAIQPEYSLIERSVEPEHIAACLALGLGVCPWGPLGAGFLTGKYMRDGDRTAGDGRFAAQAPFRKFTDRHWRALDGLKRVADELGRPFGQVALAWVSAQPGVTAPLLGARTVAQLEDNLASLELTLTPAQMQALAEASALEMTYANMAGSPMFKRAVFGLDVEGWR